MEAGSIHEKKGHNHEVKKKNRYLGILTSRKFANLRAAMKKKPFENDRRRKDSPGGTMPVIHQQKGDARPSLK